MGSSRITAPAPVTVALLVWALALVALAGCEEGAYDYPDNSDRVSLEEALSAEAGPAGLGARGGNQGDADDGAEDADGDRVGDDRADADDACDDGADDPDPHDPRPRYGRPVYLRLLWGQIPGGRALLDGRDPRENGADGFDADGAAFDARGDGVPDEADVDIDGARPVPAATRWDGAVVGQGVRVQWTSLVRFERGDRIGGCYGGPLVDDAGAAAELAAAEHAAELPPFADEPVGVARRCGAVRWRTATTSHNDGVILKLQPLRPWRQVPAAADADLDADGNRPAADLAADDNVVREPSVLIYLGPLNPRRFTLRQLAKLDAWIELDGWRGDRISAVGLQQYDGCPAGFMEGQWLRSAREQGGMLGRWYDVNGRPGGSLRGVWVPRHLLYGVGHDLAGHDLAFFEGRWGDGHFGAVGRDRLGRDFADLGGHYGPGFFHGTWAVGCDG